ncbi:MULTISPECIES: GatB/YqeY domain-containing protein [Synergistales]|nr:GatB/YqeY domain-containing protein [Aminithiophilus ramosus]
MSLLEQVHLDVIKAMKARDASRLSALRLLKAALETAATQGGRSGPLDEEEEIALVRRLVKQRREAAEAFRRGGAVERAEAEEAEALLLGGYLPPELSQEEIEAAIADVVREVGASGPRDLGRVMGPVMVRFKGKADGNWVRRLVQESLANL